jgi:hypothetical protein
MIRGIAILLAVAAAPAAQAADWSAPFTAVGDRSMTGVSVASDARGGMTVVWQHDTGRTQPPPDGGFGGVESYIRARAIAPDGRRGPIQTLSITDDLTASPALAVDRRGGAVAVWTQAYQGHHYTILAAQRAPGRRFGRRQAVGRTDRFVGGAPQVAVNARGDAAVLWARARAVQLATRGADGRFGSPQTIPALRPVTGGVVVAADGSAVAVWTAHGTVYASRRRAGHRFGRAIALNAGGPGADGATVAIGADGTVAVAWQTRRAAFAAVSERGGAFGRPQIVASFAPFAGVSRPAVVVTPSGETIVGWTQAAGVSRGEAAVASRPAGRSFGAAQVLSAPGVSGDRPALAVERRGEVVAAWSEAGPIGPSAKWWPAGAVRPPGAAAFLAGEPIGGPGDALAPVALLGADATATLLWRRGDAPLLAARRTG